MQLQLVADPARFPVGQAAVSEIRCRQPLNGACNLELRLESGLAIAPELAGPCQLAGDGAGETVKLTVREVAPDAAAGIWVRGDVLDRGVANRLLRAGPDDRILLYQRRAGESLADFFKRLFEQSVILNNDTADLSRLERFSFAEGGVEPRLPGAANHEFLTGLFDALRLGEPRLAGWTAGPWPAYAVGLWSREQPQGYHQFSTPEVESVRSRFSTPHPLLPTSSVWDGGLQKGNILVDADDTGALALLARYAASYGDDAEFGLARLPGPRMHGPIRRLVGETVLRLESQGPEGRRAWRASHAILFSREQPARPSLLPGVLRGAFSAWGQACADGGSVALFKCHPQRIPWALGGMIGDAVGVEADGTLEAVIRKPGMESAAKEAHHGLQLCPSRGDLYDLELHAASFPRAAGGLMREIAVWQAGSAVLNAAATHLVAGPAGNPAEGELQSTEGKVVLARQATIRRDGSSFDKAMTVKDHLDVEN